MDRTSVIISSLIDSTNFPKEIANLVVDYDFLLMVNMILNCHLNF